MQELDWNPMRHPLQIAQPHATHRNPKRKAEIDASYLFPWLAEARSSGLRPAWWLQPLIGHVQKFGRG